VHGVTGVERLEVDLARHAGLPVRVTLTRNRRRLVSVRRTGRRIDVRLHEALTRAPAPVRDAVARFVADGCAESVRLIRAHVKAAAVPAPARGIKLVTAGRHHHLDALMAEVAGRLPPHVAPAITWAADRRPGRRTVRLGTYDPERRLIRIHRLLDHPKVPLAVLRHVIYHELVHHVVGVGSRPHGPRFAALEARCPDRPAADAWIERHLPRHLTAVRRERAARDH
jgi:hypothetical protein